MKLIRLVTALLVVGKKPLTWIIDGTNLLHQKGIPRSIDMIKDRLQPINSAQGVVVVFDGRKDITETRIEETGHFRSVHLGAGLDADDFILNEIQSIVSKSKINRVQLVTADKRLRKMALSTRPGVKRVVNPRVFWRRYRPRLLGLKNTYENNGLVKSR